MRYVLVAFLSAMLFLFLVTGLSVLMGKWLQHIHRTQSRPAPPGTPPNRRRW